MSKDPNTHAAMAPDVVALLEAWTDRGTSTTASYIMLLASACAIAKELGKTPDEVCQILRDCWAAADAAATSKNTFIVEASKKGAA